jgi:hypothetical protein
MKGIDSNLKYLLFLIANGVLSTALDAAQEFEEKLADFFCLS